MQWFGWAVTVAAEVTLVTIALRLFVGWPDAVGEVAAASTVMVPLALMVSTSKRLLPQVDKLLAHTVSLTGLTGVVVGVYLVIVLGLGRVPSDDERTILLLSMLAAGVAALLYLPTRARLTAFSNRLVYGEQYAPDEALRTFGSRLSRAIPLDELLLQLAESLRKTLVLEQAEVWTGSGGVLERTVSVPERGPAQLTISETERPVVARAGVVGPAWLSIWLSGLLEGPCRTRWCGSLRSRTRASCSASSWSSARPTPRRSRRTTNPCSPNWPARSVSPCTTSSSTPHCRSRSRR